jgi:type IV pilus assembly protein PilM
MASRHPGAWGIDIGQCALKALRVENRNGVFTATAFDYVEHPKILSQPDADPDLLTREALEKFLSRNDLKGDTVVVSVPGQAGLARFVKLPPVEEKKIGDIVRFEAKQQIPFPLEEVVWDFQKIGSGVVTDGFAMETEIGLFAIKRENVVRALQPFLEVGIEVDAIQMAPLALCNYVSYDLLGQAGTGDEGKPTSEGKPAGKGKGADERIKAAPPKAGRKDCIVSLDMGAETTNFVITDGDRIIYQRSIGIGGNRFTRDLTKAMKLTFAKAEHLKKNATKSPNLKDILLALRPALNEFVTEVQKSLAHFTSTHRDAHVLYLVGMGGAFRLPGLQKYLQEKLQLDVRKMQKLPRLSGDTVTNSPVFNDNIMSMGVVYGLALQGLDMARLHTNLLPQEIRMERLVRSKKPWAVGAAACLLVGLGVLTFGARMEHDAVASPAIEEAQKVSGQPAIQLIEKSNKAYQEELAKVETIKQSIRSIVAGRDERLNWLKLQKFINEALPRPDGKNLTDAQREEFWDKGGGKAAYDKFMARQTSMTAAGGDEGLDDLIQINLESVNALFTDDLPGYFTELRKAAKELDGMPDDQKKNPPTGSGWVVEVRGYTYHTKQRAFIVETFIQNLIQNSTRADKARRPGEIEPVTGKVSHVVLYRYRWVEKPLPGKFELVDGSDLYTLVHGGPLGKKLDDRSAGIPLAPVAPVPPGGKAASAPVVQLPGMANQVREGWRPLGLARDHYQSRGDELVLLKGPQDQASGKAQPGQYIRTEFIALFVWKEPTFDEDRGTAPGIAPGAPKGR